jgi:hypothetical protein
LCSANKSSSCIKRENEKYSSSPRFAAYAFAIALSLVVLVDIHISALVFLFLSFIFLFLLFDASFLAFGSVSSCVPLC